MEDEAILLKIKRDFTENEAVQSLLKIISTLEVEIGTLKVEVGMLRSELAEAEDLAKKLRTEKTLTKKEWMADEMFKYMYAEELNLKKRLLEHRDMAEEWKLKYCRLAAKIEPSKLNV